MKRHVDSSSRTHCAICSCGWRGLGLSRMAALSRAADHERVVHPGDRHARALLGREVLKEKQRAAKSDTPKTT